MQVWQTRCASLILLCSLFITASLAQSASEVCIGAGKYGVVVVDRPDSTVAKKVMSFSGSHTVAVRNLCDFWLLQHLQHPNLLRAKGCLVEKGALVVVMDRYWTDLYRLIRDPIWGSFGKLIFQSIGYQILSGLEALHAKGFVHGDLSAKNILMQESGEIVVADFGFAYHRELAKTHKAAVAVGTPCYRAPELLSSQIDPDTYYEKVLDPKSEQPYGTPADMYSLGCILAELFSGGLLFPLGHANKQITELLYMQDCWDRATRGEPCHNPYAVFRDSLPMSYNSFEVFIGSIHDLIHKAKELGALDLLKGLLKKNPDERYTVEDAFNDPFIKSYSMYRFPQDSDEMNRAKSDHLLRVQKHFIIEYNFRDRKVWDDFCQHLAREFPYRSGL